LTTCLHCGEPELVEVHEVWDYRDFMLDTCCEGMRDAVSEFLAEDPKAGAEWLSGLSSEPGVAGGVLSHINPAGLRRVIDHDGLLQLDWNLQVKPVSQRAAKEFVRTHHRHCPPPAGWRFGTGLTNGSQLIGVIMVGRPVARGLDPKTVLEVNRLCIRDDIAPGLVWNGCSKMYGWASREAKRRQFKRIVTYTLESEDGTSLRAAGWVPEAKTKGGSWSCASRPRADKTSTEPKVRWAPAWCALGPCLNLAPSSLQSLSATRVWGILPT
jgi:hypothetical protein